MGRFFTAVCRLALAAVSVSARPERDSRALVDSISKQTSHNFVVSTKKQVIDAARTGDVSAGRILSTEALENDVSTTQATTAAGHNGRQNNGGNQHNGNQNNSSGNQHNGNQNNAAVNNHIGSHNNAEGVQQSGNETSAAGNQHNGNQNNAAGNQHSGSHNNAAGNQHNGSKNTTLVTDHLNGNKNGNNGNLHQTNDHIKTQPDVVKSKTLDNAAVKVNTKADGIVYGFLVVCGVVFGGIVVLFLSSIVRKKSMEANNEMDGLMDEEEADMGNDESDDVPPFSDSFNIT